VRSDATARRRTQLAQSLAPRLVLLCCRPPVGSSVSRVVVMSCRAGPKRLVLRRTLFIPKSPTEQEELASTALAASAHYMAFQDAVFQFTHGMYR